MGDFGKEIAGFATLVIGAAVLGLVIGHASQTAQLITSSASALGGIARVVQMPSTGVSMPVTYGSSAIGG